MSDQSADVVICGGGVLGAALAYELAGRGARPLLVESRALRREPAARPRVALAGVRTRAPPGRWDRCGEPAGATLRTGPRVGVPRSAGLRVRGKPLAARHRRRREAETLRQAAPSQWLGPDEVRARCAWIDDPIEGGLLREASAEIEPADFTQALILGAQTRGARVEHGRVTGPEPQRPRRRGVRVDGRIVPANTVGLAMGPWTQ